MTSSAPPSEQVFEQQLSLAMEYGLPLVLHIRAAEEDGLAVLERAGVPSIYPLHRHCFGSDVLAAATWLEKFPESMLGVTGLITRAEAPGATLVVANTRLDRLLLETDAPYFRPPMAASNPWNCSFPGHVIHVAAKVAEIKKVAEYTRRTLFYNSTLQAGQPSGGPGGEPQEREEDLHQVFQEAEETSGDRDGSRVSVHAQHRESMPSNQSVKIKSFYTGRHS